MPVNSKSMFALLCQTMDKLDRDEIDSTKAAAISKVVGQATNILTYELKRAALMTNKDFAEAHRNIEMKNFDSLPES